MIRPLFLPAGRKSFDIKERSSNSLARPFPLALVGKQFSQPRAWRQWFRQKTTLHNVKNSVKVANNLALQNPLLYLIAAVRYRHRVPRNTTNYS